MKRAEEF